MGNMVLEICVWDVAAWLVVLAVIIVGVARRILLRKREKELEDLLTSAMADRTMDKG